uniref:Uncharacterized protein n=1 Tax=Mycena chlorophos TaxID=658473 RepID=A0ABQ0KX95_MYCCL|nr:predicted protein [Mycena chlorophos]
MFGSSWGNNQQPQQGSVFGQFAHVRRDVPQTRRSQSLSSRALAGRSPTPPTPRLPLSHPLPTPDASDPSAYGPSAPAQPRSPAPPQLRALGIYSRYQLSPTPGSNDPGRRSYAIYNDQLEKRLDGRSVTPGLAPNSENPPRMAIWVDGRLLGLTARINKLSGTQAGTATAQIRVLQRPNRAPTESRPVPPPCAPPAARASLLRAVSNTREPYSPCGPRRDRLPTTVARPSSNASGDILNQFKRGQETSMSAATPARTAFAFAFASRSGLTLHAIKANSALRVPDHTSRGWSPSTSTKTPKRRPDSANAKSLHGKLPNSIRTVNSDGASLAYSRFLHKQRQTPQCPTSLETQGKADSLVESGGSIRGDIGCRARSRAESRDATSGMVDVSFWSQQFALKTDLNLWERASARIWLLREAN